MDVEHLGDDMGIVDVCTDPSSVSRSNAAINKAVCLDDNPVGGYFEYANPNRGFVVTKTKWLIEEIEEIKE